MVLEIHKRQSCRSVASPIRLTFNRFDRIVAVRYCYDQKATSQSLSATAATGAHMLFFRAEFYRQLQEVQSVSLENQLSAVDRIVVADADRALRSIRDLVDDYHFFQQEGESQ